MPENLHTHSSYIFRNIFIHVNLILWNKKSNIFLHFCAHLIIIRPHIVLLFVKIYCILLANIYTCYPPSKHINLRILSIRPHMKTNNNSNINYPYRQHYIFLKVLTTFKNNSLLISSIFLLLSSERMKLYLYSYTKLFQLYARCCYIPYTPFHGQCFVAFLCICLHV